MTHSAEVVSWLTGFATSMSVSFVTRAYVDGVCEFNVIWVSRSAQSIFGIVNFVLYYVVVLCSFLFCYGSILAKIRRQARTVDVQHVNKHPVTAARAMKEARLKRNTIKTMIVVSVVFIICWFPSGLYLMLAYLLPNHVIFVPPIYQPLIFLEFCNVCLNPFMYAAKYDVVKKKLIKWARYLKTRCITVMAL